MKKFALILTITHCLHMPAKAQLQLNITDFGAVGNGSTLNTSAIQAAIDSCHSGGGGEVIVPAGTFLSGTIFLKSNVLVNIQQGGVLKGSDNPNHYPEIDSPLPGMADSYRKRSLLYAYNQHHIGIKGEGTFDGNSLTPAFILNSDQRVFGTRFISCSNVLYENITMKNSSFWMMHNLDCDTVMIRNITLTNQGAGNNDGIGIDACRHVRIYNCTVDSYNDAVVMKTTANRPLYDVEVYNCMLSSAARVIKIGTETVGNIRKVHVHDCTVTLGMLQPAEIGINLGSIDGAQVDSVIIENIDISGVLVPIVVRLGDSDRPYVDSLPPLPAGSFKGLILRNITASGQDEIPCHITGIPNHPLEQITMENITLLMKGGKTTFDPGVVVPENITERPEHDLFGNILPAHGIYFRHITGLVLNNVCIMAQTPDARPAHWFDDVSSLDTSTVCNSQSIGNKMEQKISVSIDRLEQKLIAITPENGILYCFDATGRMIGSYEVDPGKKQLKLAQEPIGYLFKNHRGVSTSGKCNILSQ